MKKRITFLAMMFFGFSVFLFSGYLCAEDALTITTYYPSPYGVYNKMSTNRLAVGYLTNADQPNNDGDIRLKTHSFAPPSESGVAGEIAYAPDGYLYAHNGSTWVKQGGGSTCVVTYNSSVGSCSCPTGWTLKLDLGSWGICGTAYSVFLPPGGSCVSGYGTTYAGEGCFCCSS